jgi:hypothetical protein
LRNRARASAIFFKKLKIIGNFFFPPENQKARNTWKARQKLANLDLIFERRAAMAPRPVVTTGHPVT